MQISKNIYLILAICVIIVISIIIIANNTYMLLNNIEEFTNNNIDINICKNSKCNKVKSYNEIDKLQNLQTKKYPLELCGCISLPFSYDLLEQLNTICYTSYQEFYSLSIENIYQKIIEDLNKTYISSGAELNDPIYTIIYQEEACDTVELFTQMLIIYPKLYSEDKIKIRKYNTSIGVQNFDVFLRKHVHKNLQKCKATVYKIKQRNLITF